MKEITSFKRWNEESNRFDHNHIEDSHKEVPELECVNPKEHIWRPVYGFLTEGMKVVEIRVTDNREIFKAKKHRYDALMSRRVMEGDTEKTP